MIIAIPPGYCNRTSTLDTIVWTKFCHASPKPRWPWPKRYRWGRKQPWRSKLWMFCGNTDWTASIRSCYGKSSYRRPICCSRHSVSIVPRGRSAFMNCPPRFFMPWPNIGPCEVCTRTKNTTFIPFVTTTTFLVVRREIMNEIGRARWTGPVARMKWRSRTRKFCTWNQFVMPCRMTI